MKQVRYLIVFLLMFGQAYSSHDHSYNQFSRNSSQNSNANVTYVQNTLGFLAIAYYWLTGELETKKKEQSFEKERSWQDSTFARWDATDFAQHFGYNPYNSQWSYEGAISDDPIFRRFPLYRFAQFREFLHWSPYYKNRILQLKNEIQQGKVFEIDGCSHDEFKSIITEMVSEFSYKCSDYNYGLSPTHIQQKTTPPKIETKEVGQKQKQHALLKDQINDQMHKPENDLLGDYSWYQEIEIKKPIENLTLQEQYLVKRIDSLHEYAQGIVTWKEETYTISTDVSNLLIEHKIDSAAYTAFYGNQVQQVLHQEILSILGDTATIRNNKDVQDCQNITTTLTRFAHAGREHNQAGHIKNACTLADFCWGVLDCLKEAYIFEGELENAVGRGFIKGGNNFIEKVRNPIKTLQDTRNNLRSLGYLIFELTEDVKYRAYLSVKNVLQESADELMDRLQDKYVAPPLEEKGIEELVQAFDYSMHKVGKTLNLAWNSLTKENVLYAAEEGTAIATDMALSQVTLSAFSSLATNGSSVLKDIIEAGGNAQYFMNLPFSANAFEAGIAYEAVIAADRAMAVEAAGKAVGAALDKAAKIAPLVTFSQNAGSGGDGSNISVSGGGNIPNPPMDIIEAMQPFTEADRLVASKYIGVELHNGHPIIPPFEHTWVAKTSKKTGEIIGFHQDRDRFYEKLGLITEVEMLAEDFYRAKVFINGEWVQRSFVPSAWSPDELMKCYYDIIRDPDKIIPQVGRTLYRSTRKSGITVSAVVDDLTGVGITFFPNLRIK